MTSEILRFSEKPVIDESIQEYEYHEYEPQAKTNLNSAGEINIKIELQDLEHPPLKFGLLIDFDLLEAVTSTNTRPEVVSRRRGRHLENGYDVIFPQWVLRFGRNSVA